MKKVEIFLNEAENKKFDDEAKKHGMTRYAFAKELIRLGLYGLDVAMAFEKMAQLCEKRTKRV